jgi:preprotein translocase subunit YajC
MMIDLLLLISQGGQEAAPSPLLTFVPMILVFIVIWYLLIIMPQRKQAKMREEMLRNLKPSDRVLTSGGIYGVVHRVREHDVMLKIDEENNIKIRVAKNAIVAVEKPASEKK